MTDQQLLERIEGFLETTGMAPTTFGRKAMREASLIASLRDGRSLSLTNANRVLTFIQANEPPRSGDGSDCRKASGPSPDIGRGNIDVSREAAR